MNDFSSLNREDFTVFQSNDFLLNSGIVGLLKLLKQAEAIAGVDYVISGAELLVSRKFLLEKDLTQLYVDTLIQCFYEETAHAIVLQTIEMLERNILNRGNGNDGEADAKTEKEYEKRNNDAIKLIADKLSSASYKTAYSLLEEKGISCPVPELVKQLKGEKDESARLDILLKLKDILNIEIVRETLCFKSIIYSRINMFWENKAFLLTANAKKDMKPLFETEFVEPFRQFVEDGGQKAKEICISCGAPINAKEKVSVAFMKDMSDDLNRKKSAFWDCRVDAFLCPCCAFVYSLVPLGFLAMGRDMVFVNTNNSIDELIAKNVRKPGNERESENMKWHQLYNNILDAELRTVKNRRDNIQVIVRKKNEGRYNLNIIGKDILQIISDAKADLESLAKWSAVKDRDGYINVYDGAIANLLNHRNQYLLMQKLLKLSMENAALVGCVTPLLNLQYEQTKQRKGGDVLDRKVLYFATKSGWDLRNMVSDGSPNDADNKLRGLTYQLLNALQVVNENHFMNLVLRVYSSYNAPLPSVFMNTGASKDDFLNIGYAFVKGLKGGFYEKAKGEGGTVNA